MSNEDNYDDDSLVWSMDMLLENMLHDEDRPTDRDLVRLIDEQRSGVKALEDAQALIEKLKGALRDADQVLAVAQHALEREQTENQRLRARLAVFERLTPCPESD